MRLCSVDEDTNGRLFARDRDEDGKQEDIGVNVGAYSAATLLTVLSFPKNVNKISEKKTYILCILCYINTFFFLF